MLSTCDTQHKAQSHGFEITREKWRSGLWGEWSMLRRLHALSSALQCRSGDGFKCATRLSQLCMLDLVINSFKAIMVGIAYAHHPQGTPCLRSCTWYLDPSTQHHSTSPRWSLFRSFDVPSTSFSPHDRVPVPISAVPCTLRRRVRQGPTTTQVRSTTRSQNRGDMYCVLSNTLA